MSFIWMSSLIQSLAHRGTAVLGYAAVPMPGHHHTLLQRKLAHRCVQKRVQIKPPELARQLAAGDPPIVTGRVHGTGDKGFLLSVFVLQEGEERVVAERLVEILKKAASDS